MRRLWLPAALLLAACTACADDLDGTAVMKRVDAREDGLDSFSTVTFVLENEKGEQRRRTLQRYWIDLDGREGQHSKTVLFFTAPPDVAGTGLLNWSYDETGKDDDQWLYLPAFRQTKRIAAAEKEKSFLGTDFTYEDMSRRQIEKDEHVNLGAETLEGKTYYRVESKPRDSGYLYSKRVSWVEKDSWLVRKVEFYDRKGAHQKTMTIVWKQEKAADTGAPIWTWDRALMVDLQKRHKTLVVTDRIAFNTRINEDQFTKMRLEQGAK